MTGGGGNENSGSARIIVQVGALEGDVYFQTPRSPQCLRCQTPGPPPHYTNNERQLGEIDAALLRHGDSEVPSIVVVNGPPGSGKSATIYQWIFRHRDRFPDGVFYVPLEPDPEAPQGGNAASGLESEALRQCLVRVGFDPGEIPPGLEARASWFRDWSSGKRVAVVVDDAARPAQVRVLLPGFGHSVVLVTAAGDLGALRASHEVTFVDITPLEQGPARELLRTIAGADLVDAEPEATAELLRLCHGSALALSVAAAMLPGFAKSPVARLVARLSGEGRLLAVLSRDEDLSVQAVFDAAADRLTGEAHRCYLAFGQHPGTGDIGLEALATALEKDLDETEDHVEQLVAAHLVVRISESRYWVNGLVREHAKKRANAVSNGTADAEIIRDRFRRFYRWNAVRFGYAMDPRRGWLQRFWPGLVSGDGGISREQAQEWLEFERTTLRAVIDEDHRAGREDVCALAVALWPLHSRGKHLDDLDETNQHAYEIAGHLRMSLVRSLALIQRGFAFRSRDEHAQAAELFSRAVELCREHGDQELTATAIESLGLATRDLGHVQRAEELFRENLRRAQGLGKPQRVAMARMHLASVALADEAVTLLNEALRVFEENADGYNVAKTRMWLGMRLTELRNYSEANVMLDSVLEFMTVHRHQFDVAQVRIALADLALARGECDAAREHLCAAWSIYDAQGWSAQAKKVSARLRELDTR
jgi:tetratricopeptide (TPR) repeat protein